MATKKEVPDGSPKKALTKPLMPGGSISLFGEAITVKQLAKLIAGSPDYVRRLLKTTTPEQILAKYRAQLGI
jgi:hypothetical protein